MSVLALQLFLTGLSIPILLLGAMVEELRNAGNTTRALAASLMRAQDEERRRIARDLHDSTGQNLIAASLLAGRLRTASPARPCRFCTSSEQNLKQSNRELRTVSYLLHPLYLDEAGLGLALRYFLEGFEERSGIQVDLKIGENIGRLANRQRACRLPRRPGGADQCRAPFGKYHGGDPPDPTERRRWAHPAHRRGLR